MTTFDRARRRASIRARVAMSATLLAAVVLVALGYQQLAKMSQTFTRVAEEQSLTLSTQLASATAGAGAEVVGVIPYTPRGLDGVVFFRADGKPRASRGALSPLLLELGPQARAVARSGKPAQEFRLRDGNTSTGAGSALRPWSSSKTVQVTIVPHGDGVLAAGFHVEWATGQLRATTISTAMGLVGGALFLCFGLMLVIGRLVTRPLDRLAHEVRHLDDADAGGTLSEQSTPELDQLASDIGQMHEDLTRALTESSTDPLTGIANGRAFHKRLDAAVDAAATAGQPLALLAVDVDHLKLINDRYGHVAGDRVISAVARAMVAAADADDLCARIGGDEFVIVSPGSDRRRAADLGERVQLAVAALSLARLTGVPAPGEVEPSVSIGVAVMPDDADSKDALVHAADAALYEAKSERSAHTAGVPPPHAAAAALALAIEAKDPRTRAHCERVGSLAGEIARRLRLSDGEVDAVRRAGLLHDVGKIGVPDYLLQKPQELSDAEFQVMKQHPAIGYRMVRSAGLGDNEALWVLHHHEHFDGSGYPHGLSGNELPLASRVILVADAFDAMTVDRPYRRAIPQPDAVAELRRCAGVEFDPAVVEVLASLVAERAGGPPLIADRLVPAERLA